MLAAHDASAAIGIQRDDMSSYYDDRHRTYPRQNELDELETSKTRQCLKKATKFLFSHIGLVGLVVAYSVAGWFLFQLLEVHQEKVNCQEAYGDQIAQITQLKQNLVSYIQYNNLNKTKFLLRKDRFVNLFRDDDTNLTFIKPKLA